MTFRGLLRIALLIALIPLALKSRASLAPAEGDEDDYFPTDGDAELEEFDEPIDINSASREILSTLPGIGAAHADEIVRHRPYRAKRDLLLRGIVSEATYRGIRDQVIARHRQEEAGSEIGSRGH